MHQKFLFRTFLAFGLASLIQGWAGRFHFGPDALSYLEMGEFLVRGNFAQGVNAYWSPFYALLLGLASILNPFSTYWQSTLIAAGLNGLIALLTLALFTLFFREIELRRLASKSDGLFPHKRIFRLAAYVLLGWGVFRLVGVYMMTPDLLLMALCFLAFAIFLRVSRAEQKAGTSVRLAAALGATLALAYLAKGFMFIFSPFLLLGTAWIIQRRHSFPAALRSFFAGSAAFLLISGIWIAPLSLQKGHLTFGETGRLNFAWHVNHATLFVHWQGDEATGSPDHPTRLLHETPALYEFATPFRVTYPPWYAPDYWYEGIQVQWEPGSILKRVASNLVRLFDISLPDHIILAPLFLTLFISSWVRKESPLHDSLGDAEQSKYFLKGGRRENSWRKDEFFLLLLFCFMGIGLFLPVYVEDRYISVFLVAGWLVIFSSIRVSYRGWKRSLSQFFLALCLAILIASSLFRVAWPHYPKPPRLEHEDWQVATALHREGIKEGARLCSFGDSLRFYWAYLADVRIVAEVPRVQEDLTSVSEELESILTSVGVSGIVSEENDLDRTDDWIRLGGSPLFLKKLPSSPSSP